MSRKDYRPLLSIVIPTKDRYPYLEKLLNLIKSFNYDDIEIVVQDNSVDNSRILKFLESFSYPQIIYDYSPNQIPISDNSDKAILNSHGEYVCFLGDDDGVTKSILSYVKWMRENKVDALKASEVSYYWPDYGGQLSGVSAYKPFKGSVKFLDAYSELLKLCKRGLVDRGNLPVVYHGIVKRSTLEKIYEKCGTYFPGQSPDIANGVALSLVVSKFAYIDAPITIAGASVFHGGGEHKDKKKYIDIDSRPWLRPVASERWDKRVPMIGIGCLIWAESAITSLKWMGREDLIAKYVNIRRTVSYFKIYYSSYSNLITDQYKSMSFLLVYVFMRMEVIIAAAIRRIKWILIPNSKVIQVKILMNPLSILRICA